MNYSQFKKYLLDLLFPVVCLGCNQEGSWLCSACRRGIRRPARAFTDWLQPNYLDKIIVAADYNDRLLSRALQTFKYRFVAELGRDLALLVPPAIAATWRDYVLVPIPLHPRRQRLREFNQAEVLARELSRRYHWRLRVNILSRIKSNPRQMTLKRAERLQNVAQIFAVNRTELRGVSRVMLVDDVLTTSATLNEAARVLKAAGVKKVAGLVLAHGGGK